MNKDNELFRDNAVARAAQPEPIDHPLRVTAPHEWFLMVGLVLALLGGLVWAALADAERTLAGSGALVRSGERYEVTATVPGTVVEILADVGDTVEAGQAIVRLRLPELDWRLRAARARVRLLGADAARDAAVSGGRLSAELAVARAELAELAALEAAGSVIPSPRAGKIAARHVGVGQAVTPGGQVTEILTGSGRAEAVMVLGHVQWRRLANGMEARVAVALPDSPHPRILPARITGITSLPDRLPPWLSRFGLSFAQPEDKRGYLVRLTLAADLPRIPDGLPCEVEIVLARHSVLGLLAAKLGGST